MQTRRLRQMVFGLRRNRGRGPIVLWLPLAYTNRQTSGATVKNTGAFYIPPGAVVFAFCGYREVTSGAPAPSATLTLSHGGTWAALTKTEVVTAAAQYHGLTSWWGVAPADATAGSAAFNFSENSGHMCMAIGIMLNAALPTNIKTGSSASATPSLTLDAAPDAKSVVVGAVLSRGTTSAAPTPGSDFSALYDSSTVTTVNGHLFQYATGRTSASVPFAGCLTNENLMIAAEFPRAA